MFPFRALRRLFSRKKKRVTRKKRMLRKTISPNRPLMVKKTIDLGYSSQAAGTAGAP